MTAATTMTPANPLAPANTVQRSPLPVRAGVFTVVSAAKDAVQHLLEAGFSPSQITVICSDENKERYFREFQHQEPAGANTPAAAATGGALGATLGGVAAGAVGAATGGLPLLVAGGIGLMAGAVWGGFLGAMMTRGLEKEAANYYDQAVQAGKILVTVEQTEAADHVPAAGPLPPLARPNLRDAESILAQAGAEPLPLAEG